MTGLEDEGKWRHCVWPGCPNRFDIVAVFSGTAKATGWVQNVLSHHYLCPMHAVAGHTPRRDLRRAVCQCGWAADQDSPTLGDMVTTWQGHVRLVAV